MENQIILFDEEQLNKLCDILTDIVEVFREIVKKIVELCKSVGSALMKWLDSFSKQAVTPRVYHLARYSHKKRVRKKNKKRIFETLKRFLTDVR